MKGYKSFSSFLL